jgi:hypothetical protein
MIVPPISVDCAGIILSRKLAPGVIPSRSEGWFQRLASILIPRQEERMDRT